MENRPERRTYTPDKKNIPDKEDTLKNKSVPEKESTCQNSYSTLPFITSPHGLPEKAN